MTLTSHTSTDPRYDCPWVSRSTSEPLDVLAWPERVRMDLEDPKAALLPIELLMLRRPGSRTLVVHLHGSLDRQKYEIPRFERFETMKDLPFHQLWVADPTLHQDPGLRIGWYCGGAGEDSTRRVAELVKDVAAQLGVEKIVIQGSSSGGFGALALTTMVPGSLALAFSPQTNMGRFSLGRSAAWLVRAAFPQHTSYTEFERAEPTRADLAELYATTGDGRAWYIQNSGDIDHLDTQMYPFQAQVDGRVTFVLEHHCTGHNPPTAQRVRAWVEHAVENFHGDPQPFRLRTPVTTLSVAAAPSALPAAASTKLPAGLPVVRLGTVDDFRPKPGDPEQLYFVGIGAGMELAFVAGPRPNSDRVVRVGFHGPLAVSRSQERMATPHDEIRTSGHAYVIFADPAPDKGAGVPSSWYLGTADVDPDDAMEIVTRRIMAASGSPYVMAGGFADAGFVALRFAARFRNAVAVPESPQTDLFRAPAGALRDVLGTGWNGWTPERILRECPHRFRAMDRYTDSRWNRANLVHYVHNAGDAPHVLDHLGPLLAEFGADPDAAKALGGRFRFSRPYTGEGHQPLPTASRSAESAVALAWLHRQRPLAAQEAEEELFVAPAGRSHDRGSPAARARHLVELLS